MESEEEFVASYAIVAARMRKSRGLKSPAARPAPEEADQRALGASYAVASAILVSLLYGPSLRNPFVYDDIAQVVENPAIRSLARAISYFSEVVPFSAEYLSPAGAFYRPVFWLSLSLDYAAWGEHPAGFHLTNLLLHWLCGVLLFRLLRRLEVTPAIVFGTPILWMALPVNTEVVAWISGRPFSLAAAFMLSGLLALTRYFARGRIMDLAIVGLMFFAALLSHEIGILLPLLSLIVLIRSRTRPRPGIGLLGAYIVPLAAYLILRTFAGSGVVMPDGGTFVQALVRVPLTIARYAQWVLVPARLSIERSSDWTALASSRTVYLIAWLALAGTATATVLAWRRCPIWGFGMVWYVVSLLPFLNLVPLSQGMAERYAYVASIGLVVAVGSAAEGAAARWSRAKPIAALLVLCAVGWYSWRVVTRVPEWRSEQSIYETSLQATPESHVLAYNLAVKYTEAGEPGLAERLYRKAIALQPAYLAAKVNLANLLQGRGEFAQARLLYEEVLATQPDRKEAILNLANLYQRTGRYVQAEGTYRRALALDPQYVEARLNLGALWQLMGKLDQARIAYEEVLAIDPAQPQAHLNLGVLLFHRDDIGRAIEHLQHAIRLRPGYPEAHFNLGVLYESTGDTGRARREYSRALALKPDYEKARSNLAILERP